MSVIWKAIAGYEGFYEVSNDGRVRSLDRLINNGRTGKGARKFLKGRELKAHSVGKGKYLAVGLHKNAVIRQAYIHKLVFDAFVSNPDSLPEINHKDGIKTNNKDSNLEPSTRLENVRHAIRHGLCNSLIGEKNIQAKLTEEQVLHARLLFSTGLSQTTISALTAIPIANVHCIVRRKSWNHLP